MVCWVPGDAHRLRGERTVLLTRSYPSAAAEQPQGRQDDPRGGPAAARGRAGIAVQPRAGPAPRLLLGTAARWELSLAAAPARGRSAAPAWPPVCARVSPA